MNEKKKRFYWLKIREDFFQDETMDWLQDQENGCTYIVLYLRLCLMTMNTGGELIRAVGDMTIPYEPKKISQKTHIDIDTVNVALSLFKRLGLIEETQEGIPVLPKVNEMVGSESESAARVRRYRQRKKKALQSNEEVTKKALQSNEEIRDKRIEYRDKSKDNREKREEKEAAAEATTQTDFQKVVAMYQNNIHPVATPIERDELVDLYQDCGGEFVMQAIREAAIHHANSIAYIRAILNRWKATGNPRPWDTNSQPRTRGREDKQAAKDTVFNLLAKYEQEEKGENNGEN